MSTRVKTLEAELKAEAEAYNALQADADKSQKGRQTFAQQLNESRMVLKELDLLDESANVYKLTGPVLVKQDQIEARSNVSKRIEFISGELERLDDRVKATQSKLDRKRQQIQKLQQQLQEARKA